jgi:N-acetylglucosamine-6-sulfatase
MEFQMSNRNAHRRSVLAVSALAAIAAITMSMATPAATADQLNPASVAAHATAAPAATKPYTTVPAPRTNKWWTTRHAKLVKRAHQGGVNTLFLGDSITEGMNVQLMQQTLGPGAANFGISGDGTQHLLWRLQHGELDFTGTPPSRVIILIGTNHMGSTPLSASERHDVFLGVKADVDAVRAKLPNAHILVLGILPREASPQNFIRGQIANVNREISTLADNQHVWYADIGNAMLEPDGTLLRTTMSDLLHPTWQIGYERMFNAIKPYYNAMPH